MNPKFLRDKYILDGLEILDKEYEVFVNKYYLKRYMSKEDLEDMKSDVMIEMIHAIDRFDPSKSKLSTFLSPRLKGAFKDCIRKESKIREKEIKLFLEKVSNDLDEALSAEPQKISECLKNFHITDAQYKDICIEISEDDVILNHHLFDSLLQLPEKRVYIILGYFILDKSIKEIADDLNLSASSGWVYKLKRQSVEHLKEILKTKGVL